MSDFNYDEDGNIVKNIRTILHESMLPYSEYVILDRALPRVEDGLKPVQRRILYSMYELGLYPDRPFKKSAKVVGDVIANYHPHGDSSVYNAVVRLSQGFNMREPLIIGHGNFGSMDGDSPAAMRYTECKLSPISLELLRDIEKETVSWGLNYDDTRKEPNFLPSAFPNLLVNGVSGIAVGIATSIPPHNLHECIDGAIAVLENGNITVDELMEYIPAPDFPTGGVIFDGEELRNAYRTGKGKLVLRAKINVEKESSGKINLVITEFPYQINKAVCLQKISQLKEANKEILGDIIDIRDESDRNGVRSVITLKKDAEYERILAYLYKSTDLQTNISFNMVAIANGKPKQLNLKDVLYYYVEHRKNVILNRTKFDLKNAKDRMHILEGLIIAINNIDEVIKLIKSSDSVAMARQGLMQQFNLSEKQAQAILDMRLSRLTHLEVNNLEKEISELKKLIDKLTTIINSNKALIKTVKDEFLQIKKKYPSKRMSEILSEDIALEEKEKIKEEFKVVKDYVIAINSKNCIKKFPIKNYNMTSRMSNGAPNLNEIHGVLLNATSEQSVLIFTNDGFASKVNIEDVAEARWKEKGTYIKDICIGFDNKSKVVGAMIIDNKKSSEKREIIALTKNGIMKRGLVSDLLGKKAICDYIGLKDDDKVVAVQELKEKPLFVVTSDGLGVKVDIQDLNVTNKSAVGVKAVLLNDNAEVVNGFLVDEDSNFLILTNAGYAKKMTVSEFDLSVRGRKGVKLCTFGSKFDNRVIYAQIETDTFEIVGVDDAKQEYCLQTSYLKVEGRTNKGHFMSKLRKIIVLKEALTYLWEIKE